MPLVTDPEIFAAAEFDYVVIGGGTAGLVVASRLTEDPSIKVGVIEAGEWHKDDPKVNIPGLAGQTMGDPKYDWSFLSVPLSECEGRQAFIPRRVGKGLGGSSMLNLLGLNRASAAEYDAIEQLGNPGWNWQSFLKYMKKSETALPISASIPTHQAIPPPSTELHGTSGPIVKAYYPPWWSSVQEPFFQTLESFGVAANAEPGNGHNLGASKSFATIDAKGIRTYSVNYLEPHLDRPNLSIITGAHATRVVLRKSDDGQSVLAEAVEFTVSGNQRRYTTKKVTREVVLSAGTYQTPQLLELSGIGNKQILEKFGIECLLDLPTVGENMQDHVYALSIHEIDPKHLTLEALSDPLELSHQQELYKTLQGMLASAIAVVFAYLPSQTFLSADELVTAHQERLMSQGEQKLQDIFPGLRKQLELQRKWLLDAAHANAELIPFPGFFPMPGHVAEAGKRYSSMVSALMHPFSRGSVHIASADPTVPPAIDPAYFTNPIDLQLLKAILKFTLKLYDTPPFSNLVKARVAPQLDSKDEAAQDDVLEQHIKSTGGAVYHPIGTANMMPREDGGVVDPQLKVYGTANLRVVDASIIPIQISCHTQSIVYAIAERAVDIILEQN
ncbi:alcohol oxidase [Punctularia strigosozonata HHB-11173 SS5]|uniref:alcohol oxidase n=1 Tax=Punctularia strigosozonata (strain HHB-11173) TaxID=741275 RepID=UPI0004416B3D|nr:alcohol oxidase [Punctularia strigosozonata HHB-11173 SS5]EIN08374.1 alcohol oxidase [Punctularia strigosozonata HHB-11173 SS5]